MANRFGGQSLDEAIAQLVEQQRNQQMQQGAFSPGLGAFNPADLDRIQGGLQPNNQFGSIGRNVPERPGGLAAEGLAGATEPSSFLDNINAFLGGKKGQALFDFLKSAGADLAEPPPLGQQIQFAPSAAFNPNVQDVGSALIAQLLGGFRG